MLTFSGDEREVGPGEAIAVGPTLHQLQLSEGGEKSFPIAIAESGYFGFFTEHGPDEFGAKLIGPKGECTAAATHEYKPDHEHDEEVSSVGIAIAGDLDSKKLNA